jgi:DNA-binding CsgD family transcriptional regulator
VASRIVQAAQALDERPSDTLREFMDRQFTGLGFRYFGYLALQRPSAPATPLSVVSSYREDWIRRYTERGYQNLDPVCTTAAKSPVPFAWLTSDLAQRATKQQRQFLGEAAEFGVRNGITVPIRGPAGAFATLSVTADVPDQEFHRLWLERRDELHVLALYYHAQIEKHLLCPGPPREYHLTDRERDGLIWSARGKTAWETSEILGISEETVQFHLKNAMQKLGVHTKTHAVVKAILAGLIYPD